MTEHLTVDALLDHAYDTPAAHAKACDRCGGWADAFARERAAIRAALASSVAAPRRGWTQILPLVAAGAIFALVGAMLWWDPRHDAAPAQDDATLKRDIAAIVEKLKADDVGTRDKAAAELRALWSRSGILNALKEFAEGAKDAEVRRRIESAREWIVMRLDLPDDFAKAHPNFLEDWAAGSDRDKVMLLEKVWNAAYNAKERTRLEDARKVLSKWARIEWVRALETEDKFKLIVLLDAASLCGHEALRSMVDDPDQGVRLFAASVAAKAESRADELLKHESAEVRQAAVQALAFNAQTDGARQAAAARLAKALEDKAGEVRRAALFGLGQMGATAHGDAMAKRLKDEDKDVRRDAVVTLGWLRDPRHADAVGAFLDREGFDDAAVAALGLMRATGYADRIAKRLQDRPVPAVRALSRMNARKHEAAIAALMTNDGPDAFEAALACARWGKRDAARWLVERLGKTEGRDAQASLALNACRDPEAWSKLVETSGKCGLFTSYGPELAEDIAKRSGYKVEAKPQQEEVAGGVVIAGGAFSVEEPEGPPDLLDAIPWLGGMPVIERDAIRVLSPEDGAKLWKEWLEKAK